ncbi:AsmA-like C-terminal region-containing protein [Jannaschia aquimarina]|uniref:Uncharacterized protein n=1 Tax=Jannaschia aquimarina TaxID=935700 RepID=A0A0D1EHN0_9RHOB|nr:AsmA-like C-terminal region-containing protein [Jannaschia aquimarina]KIT17184.1 hypothetical protein jaqu_09140 [Jannaschia aquimarina]SNT17995.1 AsmA-like C-terminal region [Jannaschia aquimarina]
MNQTARPPRRTLRYAGLLLVLLLAFMAGSAWRLSQAPVALPGWLVDRVEQRLNRDLGEAEARLGGIALVYDLDAHALRLAVTGAALSVRGAEVLRLPEARVKLDGPALLGRRIRPEEVTLAGLDLDVARDAEGRWSLALGGGGGTLPRSGAEVLALLDAVLDAAPVTALRDVALSEVSVRLSDAETGLAQVVTGAALLTRGGGGITAELSATAPLPGSAVAIRATAARDEDGLRAEIAIDGLTIGALAEALPQVPALTLGQGGMQARAAFGLGPDGAPGPLTGSVELRDARLTDRPRLVADRIALGFAWVPGQDRIALEEVVLSAPEAVWAASGQVIFEDGLTGPVQLQLRPTEVILRPEEIAEGGGLVFEDGTVETRLTQSPLALTVGQAVLSGPSGTVRASASLAFADGGIEGRIEAAVPSIRVADLRPLWPPDLTPGSRRWFFRNMLDARARDVRASVTITPGKAPVVGATLSYEGARFRYMRYMPPAEDAYGAIQFTDGRVAIRVDRGTVPGLGPGDAPGPGVGRIDIAGTRLVIPDALQRDPPAELELKARGGIGDVLALLDNRPVRLLERIDRTRELARGRTEARVTVGLPLRDGNAPADIDWSVDAELFDVTSDRLVPGRPVEAARLALRADSTGVEIGGSTRFDGIPFDGRWRQALPPPSTEPIDPEAPPAPPQALPEPGRVRGTATATPADLARLGIAVDAVELSGRAQVALDITLQAGEPPRLRATSDTVGMAARVPAISWSKPQGRSATLEVEAVLGDVPEVTALSFEAPGLSGSGRVTLAPGGALEEAVFGSVRTPWFRGAVTFDGRGAGAAPAIRVTGGTADLDGALSAIGGGGDGGDGAPVVIALDRLQVTEQIALTGLRARIRNGAGEFSGSVNGAAPVEGVLAPRGGETVVQVRTADAGRVLRAAEMFSDARGGSMTLTLETTAQEGVLAGAVRGQGITVRDAPAMASLLQTLSVVGLVEQLAGQGLPFETVEADFTLRPNAVIVRRASAVGPSMSITADGAYDLNRRVMDMQGVVSPIYFVNGLFGALFSRRDEGLFGFTYRMTGSVVDPQVSVNPLSILTPGRFRDIFRQAPPSQ